MDGAIFSKSLVQFSVDGRGCVPSLNLEISAVATGLGKVSFLFNPKERQCQGMFKLPHNCTHLTR